MVMELPIAEERTRQKLLRLLDDIQAEGIRSEKVGPTVSSLKESLMGVLGEISDVWTLGLMQRPRNGARRCGDR